MSKAKPKDKKNQDQSKLQRQYEQQRRELLDKRFTIKKLEEKVCCMVDQNHRLVCTRQEEHQQLSEKIQQLTIKNQTNEKRLLTMRNDLTNSEVQNKKLSNTISMMEKNTTEDRLDHNKQVDEMKKNHSFEVAKYESMLADYKLYMGERDTRIREKGDLMETIQVEKANRIRQVADKERQKIQASDKIRDEMGSKMRDMKQNLLSLKKEELDTTTRLTILQNHQLTSELEYQTRQTEKIIFKNEELEAKVIKLQQEIEIHKEVEEELTKRAHFSKAVIKKLQMRIKQLEEENQRVSESEQSQKQLPNNESEKNIIANLHAELQKKDKKLAQITSKLQNLKKEKDSMNQKSEQSMNIKNDIVKIVYRFYNESILRNPVDDGEPVFLSSQETEKMFAKLKGKQLQNWSQEQLRIVVEKFLTLMRPHLNKQNFVIPHFSQTNFNGKEFKPLLPKLTTERDTFKAKQITQQQSNYCRQEITREKDSKNMVNKLINSNLREWGRIVTCGSQGSLKRKFKLNASYRN